MSIAHVDGKPVEVTSPKTLALWLAIVGILPPIVTVTLQAFLLSPKESLLEDAKLELEKRRESAALLRLALAQPEVQERKKSIQFLINAGLVQSTETLGKITDDQIPHWPSVTTASGTAR